jgi:hypothetical protein
LRRRRKAFLRKRYLGLPLFNLGLHARWFGVPVLAVSL